MAKKALNTAAWLRVLNELEQSLDTANWALAANSTSTSPADAAGLAPASTWRPPATIGPIPAQLEGRARDLLVCQQKLVRELDAARRTAGQHLAALRTVPPVRELDRSVYLDVTG
ncbi:hypothetical protein [Cryobacterium roopkundense]|uniref:Flagellar protein FlgN n=1 Tax=Cryobacterium roopkundense TaxID=1001240 RepID=A0A7W8ZV84_9MICO|nr:hypothetical protein [Cryobacterium roopkundense]MBB5640811.1 hypothetical protein [Cryobacterium roopkundense]